MLREEGFFKVIEIEIRVVILLSFECLIFEMGEYDDFGL